MDTRVEKTIERHKKGYNCAQAVACTYCDLVGVDEETMFKMTEALGLGMGCMDGTCGAVAGACILAGMKRSTGNLEKPDSKAESYKLSRAILGGFEKANGTAICKELKGIETGKVIKSCDDCIKEAAAWQSRCCFHKGEGDYGTFCGRRLRRGGSDHSPGGQAALGGGRGDLRRLPGEPGAP